MLIKQLHSSDKVLSPAVATGTCQVIDAEEKQTGGLFPVGVLPALEWILLESWDLFTVVKKLDMLVNKTWLA